MNYKITYAKVKHWWVRLLDDMTLKITIPIKKAWDKVFENILIEKWQKLLEKFKAKNIPKLEWFMWDEVIVFWEKISVSSINWDINIFLVEKVLSHAKVILDECSKSIKIPYNKLSTRNLKSKWWSCTWTNNISLNLKLVHLDKKFLEYVCVHEACHLKEKNHWKKFWDLVEKHYPNYKEIRKELKKIRI